MVALMEVCTEAMVAMDGGVRREMLMLNLPLTLLLMQMPTGMPGDMDGTDGVASMEDMANMEVMDMFHPTGEDMGATGAADNKSEEVSSLHTILFHPRQKP